METKKFEIEYEGKKIHYIGVPFYLKTHKTTVYAVDEKAAREFFKKYFPNANLINIKEK